MPEKDGPLKILGQKLLSFCPPSLSYLIGQLEGVEDYPYFVNLVKEFLPERERDILGERSVVLQVAAFANYFEDRYFPLHPSFRDGMAEGYDEITRGIPVMVQSIDFEEYHEMPESDRLGMQLLVYLLEVPYHEDNAARIPIGEECAKYVPAALLEKVPETGFTDGQCQELLTGTRYQALAYLSKMLQHNTGNFFLDVDYEDLYSGMQLEWDREDVEELTRQWHQAENMWSEIRKLIDWIEENPTANFEELLNFMLDIPECERSYGNKQQLSLPLVFT